MYTKEESGDWRVVSRYGNSKELGVRNDDGFICFLPKPDHYSGQDERYDEEMEDYKKAAHIVKAAPKLLEALKNNYEFTKYAAACKKQNTDEYLEKFFEIGEIAQKLAREAIALAEPQS